MEGDGGARPIFDPGGGVASGSCTGDEILYESSDDQVAQYICSKSKLEKECIEACEAAGCALLLPLTALPLMCCALLLPLTALLRKGGRHTARQNDG